MGITPLLMNIGSRMRVWMPSIVLGRRGGGESARVARITRWLVPTDVVLQCPASSAVAVIEAGADAIASRCDLSRVLLNDALQRRERAASTALGHGFAVPHGRIAEIDEPITLYLRVEHPVDFGAPDHAKTHHFLFIVVPSDGDADDHLHMLATVSGIVSDRRFRRRLDRADTADETTEAFRTAVAKVVSRID